MPKFTEMLSVLLTPSCWIQTYTYSPAWDAECRRLLAEQIPLVQTDYFHAQWGPHSVWIRNHPYASFRLGSLPSLRPARVTILRAGTMYGINKPEFEMVKYIEEKKVDGGQNLSDNGHEAPSGS